jgi:hypothetical protein
MVFFCPNTISAVFFRAFDRICQNRFDFIISQDRFPNGQTEHAAFYRRIFYPYDSVMDCRFACLKLEWRISFLAAQRLFYWRYLRIVVPMARGGF